MIDDLAVIDNGAIIYDRWINDHGRWWKMHGAIVEDGAMMDDWWWSDDHGVMIMDDHGVMILDYRWSDVVNNYGSF